MSAELLPEEPTDFDPAIDDPEDESELEFPETHFTDEDDARLEAFLPEDDYVESDPEPGDFWFDELDFMTP